MKNNLELIKIIEFREKDFGNEFWQQYRGEKIKPTMRVYKNNGRFLLCMDMHGKLIPKWEAIAKLVKYACIIETTNTGNIKALSKAFNKLGLQLEDQQKAIFLDTQPSQQIKEK